MTKSGFCLTFDVDAIILKSDIFLRFAILLQFLLRIFFSFFSGMLSVHHTNGYKTNFSLFILDICGM